MHRIEIKKGDLVLADQDNATCAYIVEAGKIAIDDRASSTPTYSVGPGEMFGEYGIIGDAVHYSTAKALEDSILMVVTQEEIEEKSEQADPMVHLFLNFFMDRCHSLTVRSLGSDDQVQHFTSRRKHWQNNIQTIQEQLLEQFKLKDELERALANEEFVLHFQPIISLRGGFTAGFEALIRWQHPDRGLLSPFFFIDTAENTGMINAIGQWVFKESCRFSRIFNEKAANSRSPEIFISVNISARQFEEDDMVENFKASLEETGADPAKIQLEITESVLMTDTDRAQKMLYELKSMGFQIVLDDFGTGYSSLSYLHKFPIDKLKIDRSFTHSMLDDQDSQEIVRAIAGLSHNMDIEVVAEGIETMEQLSMYRDLDCHYGQGFLIAKPLPVDEVYGILGTRMKLNG
ncbi:EAL domain-containing protein [Sneathiella sp. P13V-1]|uniref:EAL domain-containing protein n=1 Tax=Sneathiella sp. P13V-1 TaxID=2697366 RepID=UPI00187B70A7|nr:EAL domain-containing protein [Sneathiella sp. P13V-1]MBE7637649.1 EAL domain-containing protein [Sneathiella sp. P13V-1]